MWHHEGSRMLKSLVVDGFRSFRHAEIALEPVTVLVGPNGAGKTNLACALQTFATLLRTPLYGAGGVEIDFDGLGFDQLTFGLRSDTPWRFNAVFEDEEAVGGYDITVRRLDGAIRIEREFLRYQPRAAGAPMSVVPTPREAQQPTGTRPYQWPTTRSLPLMLDRLVSERLDSSEVDPVRWLRRQLPWATRYAPDPAVMRSSPLEAPAPLPANGFGLPAVLRQSKDRAVSPFPAIVDKLREAVDFVEAIGFVTADQNVELEFKVRGVVAPLPAAAMSDGTLMALFFAWVTETAGPGGLLVLEDLERSVHPYLYGKVLEWIEAMAERSATQVILSTHSPLFVNAACGGKLERLRIVERTDDTGTTITKLVPPSDEELGRALELYAEAPGTLWYSGGLGGFPSEPSARQ
ncbi:MAG: AAA family ATPase [Deltaproteobacteria bacterium]|nr:AAA family ATPase [Deltaproteobacteria bacterium]